MTTLPQDTALTTDQRNRALTAMSGDEGLDVLVVGGGVTGAGIALDAASRGLRTGIVEMGDWASGTSSWSSKLVHGGLRYLYQLNFALVHESLTERGRLLTRTAPHLVKAQPFLWPLKHAYERSYSAVGIGTRRAVAACPDAQGLTMPRACRVGVRLAVTPRSVSASCFQPRFRTCPAAERAAPASGGRRRRRGRFPSGAEVSPSAPGSSDTLRRCDLPRRWPGSGR